MKVTGTSDNMNLALNPDKSHGDNPGTRGIASASRQQVAPLLNLPDETYSKIIGNLGLNDICVLARSCKRLNSIINNTDALCKAWFSRLPSQLQTQFQTIANKLSDGDVRTWLGQFTGDKSIADDIVARRASIYFPQCLFFTVSQLMVHCPNFNAVKKATVSHSYFESLSDLIVSVTSSVDGRHVVTTGFRDRAAKIWSCGEDGQWTQKATVAHGKDVVSTIFSADGRYMATASGDSTSQILSWEGGKWTEEVRISHKSAVNCVAFNADSCDMVTVSLDNTAQLWGLGKDGKWTQKAIVSHDHFILSATFSPDGHHLATASVDFTAQIWGRDKDGQWTQKAILSHDDSIQSATFSADGCYVLTASCDKTVRIWGPDEDGLWTQKASLPHDTRADSARFCTDDTHIVTMTPHMTFIWGQSEDGQWTKKATVSHGSMFRSARLSADGHHVMITTKGKTVYILDLGKDGQWTQQTVSHGKHVNSASFSPDGRHLVTASEDGTAQIRGLGQGGQWGVKATISHSYGVYSASFSPDGRHVVTGSKDKTAQIWGQREDGQWTWKATITYYDNPIDYPYNYRENPYLPHFMKDMVNFTADGRHVVIRHTKHFRENEVQIWAIHYKDLFASPPPLKKLKR